MSDPLASNGPQWGLAHARPPALHMQPAGPGPAPSRSCRRSTAEVLALLHRLAPAATIEKASIDEVYVVRGWAGSAASALLPATPACGAPAARPRCRRTLAQRAPCPCPAPALLPPAQDVTAMVDRELQGQAAGGGSGSGGGTVDAFAWGSIVVVGPLDPSSEFDRRLAVGAGIACRLRGALREQMGARGGEQPGGTPAVRPRCVQRELPCPAAAVLSALR